MPQISFCFNKDQSWVNVCVLVRDSCKSCVTCVCRFGCVVSIAIVVNWRFMIFSLLRRIYSLCVCMMRNHDDAAICQADWPVEVSTLSNRTLLLRPPNNDSHGGAASAALCEEIGLDKYFIFQFQN